MKRRKYLLVLAIVLIVTGMSLIAFAIKWSEAGRWYGLVSGHFSPAIESEHLYFFHFEGRTEAKWSLTRPRNYIYTDLSLQIETDVGTKYAKVCLPSMQCYSEDDVCSFSTDILIDWMGTSKDYKYFSTLECELNWLINLVSSAGRGDLPRTRHHPYFYETPVHGSLVHFSLGGGGSPIVILFSVLFIACGVGFVLSLRRKALDLK